MKKILVALIVAALLITAVLLVACEKEEEQPQGHVHVYVTNTVAPNCKFGGYTEYTCLEPGCDNPYYQADFTTVTDLTKDESHVLGDWYTCIEPDCDTKETFTRDCYYCDYQTKPVTEYKYKDENGKEVKVTGKYKHTYHDDYRILVPATCTEAAKYVYLCLYCDNDASKNVVTVKSGDPNYQASLGHDWQEIAETKVVAECGVDANGEYYEIYGITEYADCSRCGESKSTVYTDPHTPVDKGVITAPHCHSAGYTTHTCSTCGVEYKRDFKEATHAWPKDTTGKNDLWTNAYTKDDGLSYVQRCCTSCGVIEEQIHMEHTWGDWSKQYDKDGQKCRNRACKICGFVEEEIIESK